jgi:hypothetical protein
VIPALRRRRQKYLQFQASLGYTARFCPTKPKLNNKTFTCIDIKVASPEKMVSL